MASSTALSPFSALSDDLLLTILSKLEDDPRDWARLACVSPRILSLLHTALLGRRCAELLPRDLVPSLSLPSSSSPSLKLTSLYKLSVCCPGLFHAGILFNHSDYGLELDIGPHVPRSNFPSTSSAEAPTLISDVTADSESSNSYWSLFDDLYSDMVYDLSESHGPHIELPPSPEREVESKDRKRKREQKHGRQWPGSVDAHLASGSWNLSREQGSKLLANRFRCDCLYICNWPGCLHVEEKRTYMLFRGVFKDFKRSEVWRTIKGLNKGTVPLNCAFCEFKETWALHSSFCLRSFYGFHDDGEPVVRAYVCENGHVSGAWTERPLYG